MRTTLALTLALVALPAAADSEREGVWIVSAEPADAAGGGLMTAMATAPGASMDDPSYLVVRCLGGRTEFLVGTAGSWGYARKPLEVEVRVEGGPTDTSPWDVSSNGKAVFKADKVEDFLRALPADGRLYVRVTDLGGGAHENVFETKGLGDVRAKAAAACGWTP